MPKHCELTGKRGKAGRNVAHSNRYFGFFGNGQDVSSTIELLWRRNSLPDDTPGSAAAAFLDGWSLHPSSDVTLPGGVVTSS